MYEEKPINLTKIILFSFASLILTICVIWLLAFSIKEYRRYQTRMDAENEVLINEIRIRQQEQLIQVEQQKAEIRVVESQGIADSQAIIDSSLTNNYLQYLAIKAQETMADSSNHTQIYIPVGTNGIPLIKTID